MQFVYHCEGDQIAAVNCRFYVNLVCTGAVPSQSSVQQVQKHGVQGTETIDLTFGDHFVHPSARLFALP